MLEDLARKHIELRGKEALCYAVPHLSTAHPHVHLVFSGTRYKSNRTLRLDHAAFRRVRRELETYQAAQYAELQYSLVYGGARRRAGPGQERGRTAGYPTGHVRSPAQRLLVLSKQQLRHLGGMQ